VENNNACGVACSLLFHACAPTMEVGPVTGERGTQRWYDADGRLHRSHDLPAVVWLNGAQLWYQHGERHRDGDLPAVVTADGLQMWYQHGDLHRDGDLPAVVTVDGSRWWYRHGKLHRDGDLPAVVWPNGHQEWWVDGTLQSDLDRAQTRRWSALRAAFVGAVGFYC
jgi:hypothetical protein